MTNHHNWNEIMKILSNLVMLQLTSTNYGHENNLTQLPLVFLHYFFFQYLGWKSVFSD